jgi:dTDP-4-amino-4,6-dideoxygalactose transaminase
LVNRDEIEMFGINCRLDTIQAVVGNRLLPQLEFITNRRIEIALRYDQAWEDMADCLQPPRRRPGVRHVYHLYMVRAKRRDDLLRHLQAQGVQAKIHYPKPIHLQPAASVLGYPLGRFPKAEQDCREIITLPAHQHLTEEEIEFTIRCVREFYQKAPAP